MIENNNKNNNNLEETKELVGKIQSVVYGILCDIDDFCRKNNIKYYLSGGTCLGAVRHKGFIPWDDDADIMMPRRDYMKFVKTFGRQYGKKYNVYSLYTDKNWQRMVSRVCSKNSLIYSTKIREEPMGIFVDIFPIDGVPKGKLAQKFFFAKMKFLSVCRTASIRTSFFEDEKYKFLKKIFAVFTRRIGARYFAIQIDKMARDCPFEKCDKVAVSLAIHYGMREIIDKKYMSEAVFLPFGDRKFPVPSGYDKYLTNLYGDYMVIPKDAQQNGYTHLHGWRVIFKDEKTGNID